jgi:hypothetical protein
VLKVAQVFRNKAAILWLNVQNFAASAESCRKMQYLLPCNLTGIPTLGGFDNLFVTLRLELLGL